MRTQKTFLTTGVLAMSLLAMPGLTLDCRAWDYKEEAKEPVKHTFAAGANTLDVDNVNGSVTVIGDSGNTIRVEGEKIIRASDKQELERGKKSHAGSERKGRRGAGLCERAFPQRGGPEPEQ